MSDSTSLTGHLLVAMPGMQDENFHQSVIYICEHQPAGAVGLIVNRPMSFPLALIFEQLHIQPITAQLSQRPLMFGGPIQPERGFVIHKQTGPWTSSLNLLDDVTVTTSSDIIRAIAADEGPQDVLVALGFSGWAETQLDEELKKNIWLVCPFSKELLYEVPFEKRWQYAGSLLGVNMNLLSSDSGHA
ncbi:MAG: YqgE/AlgH family protein [Gammaproteobacteria bacterium]|nr:YqgE/AlgH family protein [Gammaproteobacteria bacterium]